MVAIIGQQKTFSLGSNYQQEVDLNTLFRDVASEFIQTCMSPPRRATDRPRGPGRQGLALGHRGDLPGGRAGVRVRRPADDARLRRPALAADRPVLLEAITDPEVPPLPPHIKMDQANSMAKALMKGDPNGARVVRQSLKGKLKELVSR